MLKRSLALIISLLLLACLPQLGAYALEPNDFFDAVGHTFQNVRAPYMTEGGYPSQTQFFTEEEFGLHDLTILNLWDSACLFCRVELPYFQQVSEEYADLGVAVFGAVGTRMGGTYQAAYGYIQEFGLTYPNLITDDGLEEIIFQNANTPQTFFVDPTGTVVAHIIGATTYEELVDYIESFIGLTGDVDCSGTVNFADVSSLYIFIIGAAELTPMGGRNADVDGDGQVGFSDVSMLYLSLIG